MNISKLSHVKIPFCACIFVETNATMRKVKVVIVASGCYGDSGFDGGFVSFREAVEMAEGSLGVSWIEWVTVVFQNIEFTKSLEYDF